MFEMFKDSQFNQDVSMWKCYNAEYTDDMFTGSQYTYQKPEFKK